MAMAGLALMAAAPAPAPAQPAPEAVVEDGDRVVCRSRRSTHTRFPTRVCRTRAEWRRIAEDEKTRHAKADTDGARATTAARSRSPDGR